MRRVVWSNDARDELLGVLRYIAENDIAAAERIFRAIDKTGNDLADFATGRPGRVSGTYEKSITRLPYIIAYALSDDDAVVTILRVIHTSRNWRAEEWPE